MKKNIIITGASRGIGYRLALELCRQGHRVLALSRNEAALQRLQQEAGAGLDYLAFDLCQPDVEGLIAKMQGLGGQLDALVNNAGLLLKLPFEELSIADWDRLMQANLYGPAHLIQLLRPYLEKSPRAHILNVGSMGGFQGSSKFPGLLGYSASKAALANLTECLAEEWKDIGISCNCLCLGAVQTEMLAEAFPGYQAPLTSERMAAFMAYFALEGHFFYNGKVLPVSVSTP